MLLKWGSALTPTIKQQNGNKLLLSALDQQSSLALSKAYLFIILLYKKMCCMFG